MPNPDGNHTEQLRSGVKVLDELLTQTPTPGHRLFAVASVIASIYTILADALNDGKVTKEQAIELAASLDALKPLFDDPPANFVELLVSFHTRLEQAKGELALDHSHRSVLSELQQYLHKMAFTPPAGVEPDPRDVASELNDLATFVSEFRTETDRGAALVGAALVDYRLELLLGGHFLNEEIATKLLSSSSNAPLASFSARIDTCFALGLITEVEYKECVLIRRIRNRFAHRLHGLTFQQQEIADWCKNLKAMPYERWGRPRERFVNSVITLCLVLWHRPAHAASLKAQAREWVWHLAFGTKTATRSK